MTQKRSRKRANPQEFMPDAERVALVRFWYKETATGLRRDVTLSALDFISLMGKHIPPKGMQLMRHTGLYGRNTKAKWAQKVWFALDAIRSQFPLFDLNPFAIPFDPLTWRESFKVSFGRDPLYAPTVKPLRNWLKFGIQSVAIFG